MALKFPPAGHPLCEKFEVADVENAAKPGGRSMLPCFRDALSSGRSMIGKSKGAIKGVNFIVCRADGAIALVEVKVMSSKWLWIFGIPEGPNLV